MNHSSRRILPTLLAATLLAAGASPSLAQEQKPQRADYTQPPIVSLDFAGGTMSQLVSTLRKSQPKVNIVVAAEAAGAQVPAMEIHEAGLDQVLDTACAVATSDMNISYAQNRGSGEPVFAIVAHSKYPGQANRTGGQNSPARQSERTLVLSLNRLTDGVPAIGVDGMKVETILSALEVGATFADKVPTMKFHEDSGLLFLRGTVQQMSLATDVLTILERDIQERANAAAQKRNLTNAGGGSSPKKSR